MLENAPVELDAGKSAIVSPTMSPRAMEEHVSDTPQPTVEQGETDTTDTVRPQDLAKILPKSAINKIKKAFTRHYRSKTKTLTPSRHTLSKSPRSPSVRRGRSTSPLLLVRYKSSQTLSMKCNV